jgi:hypothetical protein
LDTYRYTTTCEDYKPTTTEETMEKLLTRQELYEAMANGWDVQVRGGDGNWYNFQYYAPEFTINDVRDYRRKPAKVVKPWTWAESPKAGNSVFVGECEYLITAVEDKGLHLGGHKEIVTWETLLKRDYRFAGKKCGVEVGI